MKYVLTASEMRALEKRAFDAGVRSIDLMEKAAEHLTDEIWRLLPEGGKTCAFACGNGGNGGDGFAAARIFTERGGRAIVVTAGTIRSQDALINYERARECAFACINADALGTLPRPDVWADCVYGIGLNRAPEGDALELIRRINADRAEGVRVVSCDIPSGLMADTGEIPGDCVTADRTVTFSHIKRGHLLGRGMDVCGELIVKDIGLDENSLNDDCMRLAEDMDVRNVVPARRRTAHKNDFGHLLIVAGSRGMAGAAALCAEAALRSGVGLVTVACPVSIVNILQTLVPCAMCACLSETNGALDESAAKQMEALLPGKSAIAIGPGLSKNASPQCVRVVLESGIPAVLDADALNILANVPELRRLLRSCHALTPHPGEAMRLLDGNRMDAVSAAMAISAHGCAVLLKGAVSVICGDGLYVSASGCVGMAKGGSGDVLTGMVGALIAQGMKPAVALWAASQIHGRAGEKAQEQCGSASMLASDLVRCIGDVFPV